MFKVFILITIIIGVRSQAPFYGQCGGLNWQGPRTCIIGSTCKIQSIYYSQCEPDPQNQNYQVQVLYGQCGGISWSGPKTCVSWATCQYQSEYYSQCVPATITNLITTTKFYESEAPLYGQCGGVNWSGSKKCVPGTKCEYINDYYSQCLPYKQTQIPTQPPQTTTIEDQVPLNGQCDSISWERQKTCAAGLKCEFVSDYYSHCIPSYTTTQTTNTETTKETKNTETTIEIERTTTNESVTLPPFPVSVFPGTTFKHGLEYSKNVASDEYSKYDYISIWINQPWSSLPTKTDFDPNYHGEMIKLSLKLKKLPIFYSYIIGFEAKAYMGLNHCKVDLIYNLCHFGSGFVRAYRNLLVTRYTHQATEIAKFLNDKNSPCIFLIEPDFWQYYGNEAQHEGVLSGEYMRILFDDFVEEIKKQLPNAMISWDLGSWKDEKNFTKWWNYFKSSPFIDFVHTSSGQGQADSNQYKENELKWIDYSRITGKRIIAGCGFTTDGTESANCGIWNLENKKLRINDGVIALTQKSKQNEPNFDRLTLQIF